MSGQGSWGLGWDPDTGPFVGSTNTWTGVTTACARTDLYFMPLAGSKLAKKGEGSAREGQQRRPGKKARGRAGARGRRKSETRRERSARLRATAVVREGSLLRRRRGWSRARLGRASLSLSTATVLQYMPCALGPGPQPRQVWTQGQGGDPVS